MLRLHVRKTLRNPLAKTNPPENMLRTSGELGKDARHASSSDSMRLRTLFLASELGGDQDIQCLTCTLSFTGPDQLLEHYEETSHGISGMSEANAKKPNEIVIR